MKPRRIQLSRKKGFLLPAHAVVVARPSKWGNPFKAADMPGSSDADRRRRAVERFERWLHRSVEGTRLLGAARRELKGKSLGCWCRLDQPCHAEILLQVANGYGESDETKTR